MKNVLFQIFPLLCLLMLSSAFVNRPVNMAMTSGSDKKLEMLRPGGAFVIFAGKHGGEITKREMAGQREIKVDGCARGARIFEFKLVIVNNGKTSTLSGNSGHLSSEMRTQLNNLGKGDTFEFQNAKAYLTGTNEVVNVMTKKFVVA